VGLSDLDEYLDGTSDRGNNSDTNLARRRLIHFTWPTPSPELWTNSGNSGRKNNLYKFKIIKNNSTHIRFFLSSYSLSRSSNWNNATQRVFRENLSAALKTAGKGFRVGRRGYEKSPPNLADVRNDVLRPSCVYSRPLCPLINSFVDDLLWCDCICVNKPPMQVAGAFDGYLALYRMAQKWNRLPNKKII